jgi:hypothetical protein
VTRRIVSRVVTATGDCPKLGARVMLALECGHTKCMKASQAPVRTTDCRACDEMDRVDRIDPIDKDEAC